MKNKELPTRLLHIMLRVKNLEASVTFYTEILGMRVLRKKDYTEGRFTLVFLGFQNELKATVLELTYNWDEQHYQKGNSFGHLAVAIDDIQEFCQMAREAGVPIKREPAPMKFDASEMIAFIEDPDGCSVEIIERK